MNTGRPRVLLAVDLSYQTYRAAAAYSMLTSRRRFTGGLFGFVTVLAKAIRETKATQVVFCLDSKPYIRSREYPAYKLLRKESADSGLKDLFKESEPLIKEFLDFLGWPTWGMPGYESDDLIGHAVNKYRNRFTMIYANSNDSDLHQLLNYPQVAIYRDNIKDVVNRRVVWDKYQLTPDQFMLATAMMGTHNDVEGIARVGIKTATAAVRDPVLYRKVAAGHEDLIKRNLGLIKLPHPTFPRDAVMPVRRAIEFDHRGLIRWLDKFDIDVTPSMINSLEQIFNER